MATRMRRTMFAGFGVLAITGSLFLTGCGDTDDDCDSMGTQQRSAQEITLAGSSMNTDNLVELPDAATPPSFVELPSALQANSQADGNTQILADDCGEDDNDDDDGED